MGQLKFERATKINLRDYPELNERWVQDLIAKDPSILGLGDVILKDKERRQPKAGRLDLLLQNVDSNRRYEVEVQLGKTDESHIIRTIEYWDIERKRYPHYEHTAVIVAEEITGRFLNVIGLMNSSIRLIAIQMNAVRVGESVSLIFTTVLNLMTLGPIEEDESAYEIRDRAYWENRGTKATVAMADEALSLVKELDPTLELKYNAYYIGLVNNGHPNNFVIFKPQKTAFRFEPRIKRSDEIERALNDASVELLDYDDQWGRYRIRLSKGDIQKHMDLLKKLLRQAYQDSVDEE